MRGGRRWISFGNPDGQQVFFDDQDECRRACVPIAWPQSASLFSSWSCSPSQFIRLRKSNSKSGNRGWANQRHQFSQVAFALVFLGGAEAGHLGHQPPIAPLLVSVNVDHLGRIIDLSCGLKQKRYLASMPINRFLSDIALIAAATLFVWSRLPMPI